MRESPENCVSIPQAKYMDELDGVPVVTRRPVPTVATEQKTVEVRQTQHIDRIIDVPMRQIQEQIVEVVKIIPERVSATLRGTVRRCASATFDFETNCYSGEVGPTGTRPTADC